MPITDEALLQIMFKHHEGQPIEFIMAEYGKAKRIYLEVEQELAQIATYPAAEVEEVQINADLPAAGEKDAEPKKRFTKRSLKFDPKKAIQENSITCCLCGEELQVLNSRHLAKHGISVEDYKKLCGYPDDLSLMSKKRAQTSTEQGKKLAKVRAEKLAAKAAPEAAPAAE